MKRKKKFKKKKKDFNISFAATNVCFIYSLAGSKTAAEMQLITPEEVTVRFWSLLSRRFLELQAVPPRLQSAKFFQSLHNLIFYEMNGRMY